MSWFNSVYSELSQLYLNKAIFSLKYFLSSSLISLSWFKVSKQATNCLNTVGNGGSYNYFFYLFFNNFNIFIFFYDENNLYILFISDKLKLIFAI